MRKRKARKDKRKREHKRNEKKERPGLGIMWVNSGSAQQSTGESGRPSIVKFLFEPPLERETERQPCCQKDSYPLKAIASCGEERRREKKKKRRETVKTRG